MRKVWCHRHHGALYLATRSAPRSPSSSAAAFVTVHHLVLGPPGVRADAAAVSEPRETVPGMTTPDPPSEASTARDRSRHRGVGFRFRRPLTDAELGAIADAAKRPGRTGGLDGAFRATW